MGLMWLPGGAGQAVPFVSGMAVRVRGKVGHAEWISGDVEVVCTGVEHDS